MPKKSRLTIKNWAEDDRPREKLLKFGANYLSDAELIAILIASGNKDETSVELSKRILSDLSHNLHKLAMLNISELMSYKGIGEAKAISIIAALELGKRSRIADLGEIKKIKCSEDVFNIMYPLLTDLTHEEFWVIYLNQANVIIDKKRISQGGISATLVDKRIIFKFGLLANASGIILVHNHPSGNKIASNQDIKLTNDITEAAKIIGINILDHIIICRNNYLSMVDDRII